MPPGSAIWDSLYESGEGVEQSWEEAVRWYRAAAEQGCPVPSATWPGAMSTARAWSRTGSGLSTGTDRRRTRRTPRGCSVWASAANTAAAWNRTGKRRSNGTAGRWMPVPRRPCATWACATSRGEGVEQDAAEAARLYRQAAEREDAAAQCNLGYLYETGERV